MRAQDASKFKLLATAFNIGFQRRVSNNMFKMLTVGLYFVHLFLHQPHHSRICHNSKSALPLPQISYKLLEYKLLLHISKILNSAF
ncbi:hypothetical protein EE612_030158 [Oryza sativa]|nr:hypothetical protein EE612_030158 [Oryza sativa]